MVHKDETIPKTILWIGQVFTCVCNFETVSDPKIEELEHQIFDSKDAADKWTSTQKIFYDIKAVADFEKPDDQQVVSVTFTHVFKLEPFTSTGKSV